MTPNTLKILELCIETGLQLGWTRAHKHTDTPNNTDVLYQQFDCIMTEIYDYFDFTPSERPTP